MKKFLGASVLAIAAAVGSLTEAQAWCNVRMGAGASLSWQSANNRHLFSTNGQVPGYPTDVNRANTRSSSPSFGAPPTSAHEYGAPMFSAPLTLPSAGPMHSPAPSHGPSPAPFMPPPSPVGGEVDQAIFRPNYYEPLDYSNGPNW